VDAVEVVCAERDFVHGEEHVNVMRALFSRPDFEGNARACTSSLGYLCWAILRANHMRREQEAVLR
jgi:hypothetical protein